MPKQIYFFAATLVGVSSVRRTIATRDDQTLGDQGHRHVRAGGEHGPDRLVYLAQAGRPAALVTEARSQAAARTGWRSWSSRSTPSRRA